MRRTFLLGTWLLLVVACSHPSPPGSPGRAPPAARRGRPIGAGSATEPVAATVAGTDRDRGGPMAGDGPGASRVTYTFDSGDEGFRKRSDQPASEVWWSRTSGRVEVIADRRDGGEEMLVRALPARLTPDRSFSVRARWGVTAQGHFQFAIPVFLAGAGAGSDGTRLFDIPGVALVGYQSLDQRQRQDPQYDTRYTDLSGRFRTGAHVRLPVEVDLEMTIVYDADSATLVQQIGAGGEVIDEARYRLGSGPGDGFAFDEIGVAALGRSQKAEAPARAWIDDIEIVVGATG